jgi:hypothetical protein
VPSLANRKLLAPKGELVVAACGLPAEVRMATLRNSLGSLKLSEFRKGIRGHRDRFMRLWGAGGP